MQFCFDRTGFPLIEICNSGQVGSTSDGYYIHLLPVAKVQLERFLEEPNKYNDAWYDEILGVLDRVSYRDFSCSNRECIFVGGIWPDEALDFARWLDGFRLPTVDEWRRAYRYLESQNIVDNDNHWEDLLKRSCEPAQEILKRLREQLQPQTWLELSLLRGGFLEWVELTSSPVDPRRYAGLGSPRGKFHPNLWNPLKDLTYPINNRREKYFGFRLVKQHNQSCEVR